MNEKNLHLSLPPSTNLFYRTSSCALQILSNFQIITVLVLRLTLRESGLISLKALVTKKKLKQFNKLTHFCLEVSKEQTALGFSLGFGLVLF